jgi:hypothetical protein
VTGFANTWNAPGLEHASDLIERLEAIEQDLATKQPDLEKYSDEWTRLKRDKLKKWAEAYMASSGKEVTTRKASAILQSEDIGIEEEAKYVGLKAVVEVLSTRASICQTLLNSHGRA